MPVAVPADATDASDVELRSVVKRFGSFVAVDGIDLSVRRGEFVTLLGPSGCGKTTTLRMIGGFEAADSGEVLVAGRPVAGDDGAARPTRMVFQNYALFPHMTVAQNVAFGLRMQNVGRAEIESRVRDVLALLGLAAQIGKFPRQMSGGQQQRVALARALVTRPRVLLLDEPLGALDLKMRKHMQNELKALQRDVGITFIYVTHDQEEAMNLSDTIVVMDHGRIVQQGLASAIYEKPDSAYVADFIGEANLLPAVVSRVSDGQAVATCTLGTLQGDLPTGYRPATGEKVLLSLRPEHVEVGGGAVGCTFRQTGRLTGISYLGSISRLTLSVDGLSLRADVPGAFAAPHGQEIPFGWNAGRLRVLKHDDRFGAEKTAEQGAS